MEKFKPSFPLIAGTLLAATAAGFLGAVHFTPTVEERMQSDEHLQHLMRQNEAKEKHNAELTQELAIIRGEIAELKKLNQLENELAEKTERAARLDKELAEIKKIGAQKRAPCNQEQERVIQKAKASALLVLNGGQNDLGLAIQNMSIFCGTHWSKGKHRKTLLAETLRDADAENGGEVSVNYPVTEALGQQDANIFHAVDPEPFTVCVLAGSIGHEAAHVITPQEQEPLKKVHDSAQNDWIYQIGDHIQSSCQTALTEK